MDENTWSNVLGLWLIIFLPLFVIQYYGVVRPTRTRFDYWLKQQKKKDKE